MPPMTTITMADGLVSARPRNTNFSIAAIMSEKKAKEEMLEEEEEEEEEERESEAERCRDSESSAASAALCRTTEAASFED